MSVNLLRNAERLSDSGLFRLAAVSVLALPFMFAATPSFAQEADEAPAASDEASTDAASDAAAPDTDTAASDDASEEAPKKSTAAAGGYDGMVNEITAHEDETAEAAEINLSDIEYAVHSKFAPHTLLLGVDQAGDRLVAVGEYGHVVFSDDKGETWTQADAVPTQVTLTSVDFVSDKVGYAVGHDSTVIKTEDGGETWNLVYHDSDSEAPLMTVYFFDENHGLAMGAFSFVIETRDGGKTWRQRDLGTGNDGLEYHLNAIFADKDGNLWVPAEFGTVYKSSDSGKTFQEIVTPYEGSFWNGIGLDDGTVLVIGMRGNAYYTKDGGESWEQADTGTDKSIGGAAVLPDGRILLVGLQGYVGFSEDGGESFEAIARRDRRGYQAIIPGPDGQVAIFGEGGVKLMPDTYSEAKEKVGSKAGL